MGDTMSAQDLAKSRPDWKESLTITSDEEPEGGVFVYLATMSETHGQVEFAAK